MRAIRYICPVRIVPTYIGTPCNRRKTFGKVSCRTF